MNEGRMLRPALAGGILLGVLSSLPILNLFNLFCCAWVIGGGMLASYLYVKDSPTPVTLGRGAGLGLASGVIGTIVSALFSIPLHYLMLKSGVGMAEQMQQMLDLIPNVSPETRALFRGAFAGRGLDSILLVFSALLMLVIYGIFATLGGTIGVALFEKRKLGAPPGDLSGHQPPAGFPPPPPPDAP